MQKVNFLLNSPKTRRSTDMKNVKAHWAVQDNDGTILYAGETRADAREYAALWNRDCIEGEPHKVVRVTKTEFEALS